MTVSPAALFLAARAAAVKAPIGDGGPDTCVALTEALDEVLVGLASGAGSDLAVVAVGGYGRSEQCIWSDVDVMILHRRDDPEPLVRALLYPLWDAGLKVGHAVRTVDQCRTAALDDLETLTSLLSARLVAGDAGVFEELIGMLGDLVRSRPLTPALVAQERARRRTDPYPVMAADLKEGRGGLRTHQGFWWERRRATLLGLPVLPLTDEERRARAVLLRIRNALHAVAGKASDRFVVDLREPAAAWLGSDVATVAGELVGALEVGDRLADRRWPDLHTEQDPMVGFGRRILASVKSRFTSPQGQAAPADRVLAMAVAAAGRTEGAWLETAEQEAIRSASSDRWTASDRKAFVELLSAGPRGRTVFGQLVELGWVEREFPEFEAVATAPQLAPFHDHPVGAHLWRTVAEMRSLVEGGGTPGRIAGDLGSTEELYLAAFFHDIGKARGGDHATVGAELTEGFLRRHGYGAATIGVVVDAVRHHLLLSETATRRDIDAPAVIDEVAGAVGDLRRLDVLYLVTIADLRATGTRAWNSWRAELLSRLYRRVRSALEAGGAAPATPDVEAIVAAVGEGVDRRSIEEHVAAMPDDYLETTPPAEIRHHVEVADALDVPGLVVPDRTDPTRVLVAGRDRRGFLLSVTRAFTVNGVRVLDARLRTRADGIALDSFHVVDDRTGDPVPPERWDRVTADLIASLEGRRDLLPPIAERVEAYRPPRSGGPATTVRVGRQGRFTVVEVRARDRVGLLAEIVEALYGEGLDIFVARIDTVGDEARDVFYTRRVGGIPILLDEELSALRRRLEDRLAGV